MEEEKIQRSNHLWESGMVEKAKIFRGREEETVSMHLQAWGVTWSFVTRLFFRLEKKKALVISSET